MATTNIFAYNTGPTILGTTQFGDLAVGTPTSGFTNSPQFWNGPDEDLKYIIAHPTPAGTQPNPVGIPAYVGFWGCDKNDSDFISLSEYVAAQDGSPQNFATGTDAKTWLDNNGYWTSYPDFPSSLKVYLDSGNVSSYSGSGSVWYDLTDNNNDATLINSPTYSASFNGILQFDDVSLEYATIPNIGNLSAWTVEVWFRLTSALTGKVTAIATNQFDLVNKLNYSIGTNNAPTTRNIASGFFNSSGWHTTSGVIPQTGTWYQVVGTYDGSTIRQYVNGVASGGTLNYSGIAQSGGEIRLMRRWDETLTSSNFVDGDLAIVKIYNQAITSSDVLQSFNTTKTRFGIS